MHEDVAQLVECQTPNLEVIGSNPNRLPFLKFNLNTLISELNQLKNYDIVYQKIEDWQLLILKTKKLETQHIKKRTNNKQINNH